MQEKRQYIRFNAEGSVILQPKDGSSRSIEADLVDISFLGMGVYAQEKIEADTDVEFKLITKLLNEPIIGEGKIRYAKEIKRYDTNVFRIGIEFVSIDKKAIQRVINLIQAEICEELRKKVYFKRPPPNL